MDAHFDNCRQEFREVAKKVRDDMYIDDLVTGGEIINEIKKSKSGSIILFQQGGSSYISAIPTKKYQKPTIRVILPNWILQSNN